MSDKKITIEELEILFDKMINLLKFQGIKQIDIKNDFHSYIPASSWEDLENHEIIFGSFFDDLDWLKMSLEKDDDCLTFVDFDRVAHILQYISNHCNPEIIDSES